MSPTIIAISKAITAAVLAFLTALITAVQSGGIDAAEWLTALVAFVVALGAVFSVPYQPLPPKRGVPPAATAPRSTTPRSAPTAPPTTPPNTAPPTAPPPP